MKKNNKRKTELEARAITIGIDLGDKFSHYCQLDEEGKEVESGKVLNSEASVRKHFGKMPSARIALEAGARTHWWVQQLERFGHQVLVANAREFAQSKTRRKNDSNDAERLARYARIDPEALRPVTLRNAQQQNDLRHIRVRHALLRTRTGLVNLARGIAKEAALRLPASITRNFAQRSLALLSPELAPVLLPVLTAIDDLTQKIEDKDEMLEQLANQHYPETQFLRSVAGVGTLTALTYVLTLGSAQRFAYSRDVGCYLGLRPAQRQSGESDPQLGISKHGNSYLRQLLVQCAHHILGPFGKPSKLRDWGLVMTERGGKHAKKRAVTAVARKLAVLLHRLWSNQTFYEPFFEQPTNRVLAMKA